MACGYGLEQTIGLLILFGEFPFFTIKVFSILLVIAPTEGIAFTCP